MSQPPRTNPALNEAFKASKAEDWKYLSEGSSSIVFSYTGSSDSPLDATVLRLRKRPVRIEKADKFLGTNELMADDEDDLSITFQNSVVAELVSPEFLPKLESVSVHREWLKELSRLVEPLRPAHRTSKDRIDESRTKAVLASNAIGTEGIAIEIKVCLSYLMVMLPSDTRHVPLHSN